jgi:hypothetical protein
MYASVRVEQSLLVDVVQFVHSIVSGAIFV